MAARSGKQETRPRRFGTSSEGGSGGSAPARAYCFPAEQTNKATGSFYIRISPRASFSGFVSPSPPGSWPISLNTACRGEGVKREARPRPEGRPRGALLLRCQLSAWIFSAQLLSSAWPCHVGAHRLCPRRPMTPARLQGAARSLSVLLAPAPRFSCTWGAFPVHRPHEAGVVSSFSPESSRGRRRPGRQPRVGVALRTEREGWGRFWPVTYVTARAVAGAFG